MKTAKAIAQAARLEDGGWMLTLPLTWIPSSNRTTREHWSARKRRVSSQTTDLIWLLHECGAQRVHLRKRSVVAGDRIVECEDKTVFERASLRLILYFAIHRRRDPGNWGQGAGAKSCIDSLVRSCWLMDDDSDHLRCEEPVLRVDPVYPRAVVELRVWDGNR